MSDTGARVVVVGAGAVGVSAAYHLADRGVDVTLVERGHAAGETTGKAAGLAFSQFHHPADVRVMSYSLEFFREFSHQTPHFEFRSTGFLRVGTEAERETLERETAMQREQGADVRLLEPPEIAARYPALDLTDVTVGSYSPGDGEADPHTFATALLGRAEELGVDYRPETAVDGFDVADGELQAVSIDGERHVVDAAVVAAGPWSRRVADRAGVSLPLKPYRTQALVTTDVAFDVDPVYDAHAGVYFRSERGGLLAGDGTEDRESDPEDHKQAADFDFLATVGDVLEQRLPVEDLRVQNSWAGLGTATPDTLPLVGATPVRPGADGVVTGLYVGVGLQAHGFMRSPAVGRALAAEIVDDEVLYPAYHPTRFEAPPDQWGPGGLMRVR